MALETMRFRVYTGSGASPVEPVYDVTVMPGDRMRAERHSTTELAPSQRGPESRKLYPESWCMLWLWCAATRLGFTAAKFTTWADTVLDYDRLGADGEPLADATDDPEDEPVDPTQPVAHTSGP